MKIKIYEEVVVEQIAAKHQKTSEDQETDKHDTTDHEGMRVDTCSHLLTGPGGSRDNED
jgi:hypothetical protein